MAYSEVTELLLVEPLCFFFSTEGGGRPGRGSSFSGCNSVGGARPRSSPGGPRVRSPLRTPPGPSGPVPSASGRQREGRSTMTGRQKDCSPCFWMARSASGSPRMRQRRTAVRGGAGGAATGCLLAVLVLQCSPLRDRPARGPLLRSVHGRSSLPVARMKTLSLRSHERQQSSRCTCGAGHAI